MAATCRCGQVIRRTAQTAVIASSAGFAGPPGKQHRVKENENEPQVSRRRPDLNSPTRLTRVA